MERLLLIPFVVAGVAIIVYHRRLAEAFRASQTAFWRTLGTPRLLERWVDPPPGSKWRRFLDLYGRAIVVLVGVVWMVVGLLGLLAPLLGGEE